MVKQLLVLHMTLGALLSKGGRLLSEEVKMSGHLFALDLTPFSEYTQISFGIFWGKESSMARSFWEVLHVRPLHVFVLQVDLLPNLDPKKLSIAFFLQFGERSSHGLFL